LLFFYFKHKELTSRSTSLRRAHFNPRKRGRKAKTEGEKRGGKGGGNWPPMDALKEGWILEIEEVVDGGSQPVDFDDDNINNNNNDDDDDDDATADAEDEEQGEQELLVSTAEQAYPSSVSLSPDDPYSNILMTDFFHQFTTVCPTHDGYDSTSNISSTYYPFDSQQAFPLPEMDSFKLEDFQTQQTTSYLVS